MTTILSVHSSAQGVDQDQVPVPVTLSDKVLLDLCQQYGKNARFWMRKFAVLLPEVFRRHLYRKKGFCSIHDFAGRVSGMNRATCDQVLNLDRLLEGKPILKSLVGRYGWSKIRVVASVSTSETDGFWAEKVRILPKMALEAYVRGVREHEERKRLVASGVEVGAVREGESGVASGVNVDVRVDARVGKSEGGESVGLIIGGGRFVADSGLFTADSKSNNQTQIMQIFPRETCWDGKNGVENDRGEIEKGWINFSIKLDPETEFQFRLLKQEIEKERKEAVTFGEVIKYMFLQMKRDEIVVDSRKFGKEECAGENFGQKELVVGGSKVRESELAETEGKEQNEIIGDSAVIGSVLGKSVSRYIPANIRHEIERKYQHKCAFPNCNKPADVLHHTQRFALTRSHSAETIKPLCHVHHDIAHASLINEDGEWRELMEEGRSEEGADLGQRCSREVENIDKRVREMKGL